MFYRLLRYAALSATVVLLVTCTSQKDVLKVTQTNFVESVDRDQNLSFTFNKPLVPDSLLGKWDTTEYLQFTPRIKGKFRWDDANTLVFSPAEMFAPSTDYKATLTKALLTHSKTGASVNNNESVQFHTPYLDVVGTQIFYALDNQTQQIQIRLNLTFNCDVRPNDLQQRLHLTLDGENQPFEIKATNPDDMIAIAIPDKAMQEAVGKPLQVTIDEGLGVVGSSYTTKEKLSTSASLPARDKLVLTEMTSAFVDGKALMSLMFNQPILSDKPEEFIKVEPKISYIVEKTESGLQLSGDFEPAKTYTVTVSKNITGIFNYTLENDYSDVVSFGEIDPYLEFANGNKMYLSSAGNRNIAIRMAAIQKVKLTIAKVYENNIQHFLNRDKDYDYSYEDGGDDDYNYHEYRYYNYDGFGDKVSEKTYDVTRLPRDGNMRLLNLSLDDLNYNDNFKGVYILKVEDTEHQWLQSSVLVSMSDMGMMVKQSRNRVTVFVNSIVSTNPLNGVKVDLISNNNQKLFTATTDGDGVATFDNLETKLGPFIPGMISCRKGNDFNFILLDKTRVETSRYDVGGRYSNSAKLDAFIYTDRNIYRPGDTIHTNTIIRTENWETQKDIPVKLKLVMPNGKEFQTQKKNLNNEGAAAVDFSIPASIITGFYVVEAYTANDVLLASNKISVEEFLPDRINLTVKTEKDFYNSGDNVVVKANAVNFFGPPAAMRNYEITMSVRRKEFFNKKFNNYIFNMSTARSNNNEDMTNNTLMQDIVRQGKTDDQGNINESFALPATQDMGLLQGRIYTTVFDETGRPVNRVNEFDVLTQQVFYGIQDFNSWVSTRTSLPLRFIALNKDGKPVNADAEIQVYRYRWETVLTRRGSRFVYDSQRKEQLMYTKKLNVGVGGSELSFTPLTSGDYEVRIARPGANNYVSKRFYAYGGGDTDYSSFEVSSEGEVIMEADKETYNVGDNAKVLLKTPFDGKVLITIERGDVLEHFYKQTENRSVSISIPLQENYLPNVFVTAIAIRPMNTEAQVPLTVARGFIPLKVEEPNYKLPVTIQSVDATRSRNKQIIKVKTIANAQVTIAAVDEGILQVKNFKTPDPYGFFFAQKALEVTSFDLYPYLYPEIASFKSSVGGDIDMSKRVNPMANRRVQLVAKWSGILKTNSNGETTFTVDVPQFSGSLRVMAVAYKGKSFGSAEKQMRVADPVVISTALPRFITPGDTLDMPIMLSNTTTSANNLSVNVNTTGPLKIVGTKHLTTNVGANTEQQVLYRLAANMDVGESTVTVSVNNSKENFTDETHITIRPAGGYYKVSNSASVKGGTNALVDLKADMLPNTMDAKLVLSRSPMIQFASDLRYLLEYPYGCLEQTTSAAFPQLYYGDLVKSMGINKKPQVYNPEYNVREAIRKIESMQLYNGSFSYWAGGTYDYPWVSCYATHFLLEAKKAGYDVNQSVVDKALAYLQTVARNRKTYDYYYWDQDGVARSRRALNREVPYAAYVMAIGGKYDVSTLNFCKSNQQLLTPDAVYMVACAYAFSGQLANYQSMLPDEWVGGFSTDELSGSFASPVRDVALALNCILETNPDDTRVGPLAQRLSSLMKKAGWMNTQERSFAMLALGKIAKRLRNSDVTGTVSVDGKQIAQFKGETLTIDKNIAGKTVTLNTSGNGTLYYYWEMDGVASTNKIAEEDKQLKVRRTYYDRYGHELTSTNFKQNDLVVVQITLQSSKQNFTVDNVAVSDMLPAGFEIENPRISAIPELTWIKDASEADYVDIRDDRINLFTSAQPKEKRYYYVVRAVSKGKFLQGPVTADAMYDHDYHSSSGSKWIKIE